MEKYRAPSRAMIVAMETIAQTQKIDESKQTSAKAKADWTEEDEMFEANRMTWEKGTVIAVSSQDAANSRWTPKRNR